MIRSRLRLRGGRSGGGSPPVFDPTNISGLQLWLDASDTGSIIQSGGSVSQWNDKSGNARHATQGTGVNQPTTNLATINSKNAIRFDGSNDRLDLPSGVYTITNGDYSIFAVAKYNNTSLTQSIFWAGTTGPNREHNPFRKNSANTIVENGCNTVTSGIFTTPSVLTISQDTSTAKAWCGLRNGTALSIYQNGGVNNSTAGTAISFNSTSAHIGAAAVSFDWLNADLAEVIIYNTALTTTQLNQVGQYLAGKWGITWTNI